MLKELNQVIDYIEEHLTADITLEEISKYAGVSDYHFRKIFYYLSGLTLNEYIKNRKLSEANKDLLNNERVTDVAFKYGYESIDGFTRAFKSWSGFLPSEVAKTGVSKSFPKLSFYINVKGGESMDYKIVEMPAFKFAGVSKRVPMQFEGVNNAIVELANSITQEQKEAMHAIQNIEPYEVVNASYEHEHNFMKDEGDLTHLIGVLTTEENVSELLDVIEVPAYTWAVFPNEGPFPETLQQTYAKTVSEWLPISDYEVIQAPGFSFTRMDEEKENYAYSEVWMAVRKRK
ncbi:MULTISPECIES: AraC family transcriptional regulator [Eubacteriales]|jgi:AraC family transcriptional regulator|uniref:AraC family transcriptional regulator n=1 Tax=Ruminiclostridium herbifermentans TaxID=2488810 RepID=A0A4U7J5J7_9FIRM|nr:MULTISPECIES: AraC family transcriptional regulator [Eubacteriales]MBU5304669.1 AraC family transcriptional regulator [Eubacterium callanderi]QNU66301.1 AraC family transcriptional regulator [Ruminiclostridium herbifermentans]